jgi:hypothetical protein
MEDNNDVKKYVILILEYNKKNGMIIKWESRKRNLK